jgi:hypothetical protein
MKIKSLAVTTALAISGTISTGCVMPTMAITFNPLYFGEDINADGGANPIPNSLLAATNFLSSNNLSSYTTQNFDSVTLAPPSANPATRALTPGTALTTSDFPEASSITTTSTEVPQMGTIFNFSTKGVRFNDTATTPTENGRFAISGSQYYDVGNGTFTITFGNPMAALGFYATDIEDSTGIILTFDNNPAKTLTIPRSTGAGNIDKSALYYGFVAANSSEVFNSVTFGRSIIDSNDKFGLDDLSFATPAQVRNFGAVATSVPEPMTIVGTLLGGSAILRLRKKFTTIRK